jgi:pimeloyl-ACP methyl ester carboxylesterase
MREEAILLGPHRSLVGIYTPTVREHAARGPRLAVVLLNAGLIHHVGPNRLYVRLARVLAARGIAAVRVDFSGIGDSSPRPDHLPAEELGVREPQEILDDLSRRGLDGFVMCGVCSGARHALLAARDRRVKGLILINQSFSVADVHAVEQLSAQYYLRRSLRNPRAWRNLVTGKVKYRALFTTLFNEARRLLRDGSAARGSSPADLLLKELEPALVHATPVLIVFSDRHAEALQLLGGDALRLQRHQSLRIEPHPRVDHLFTSTTAQAALVQQVCEWTEELARTLADTSERAAPRAVPAD